ncbi:MAG: pentapeptide repeat-containing protein, partial [Myxococcales bacterium]|nr:pentapeptide repeat-containing protein [Myxococcales bacterium]
FKTLWALFADEELVDTPSEPKTIQQFHHAFRSAFARLRASPVGEPLRAALSSGAHAAAIREHLAWDFCIWPDHHVFGNRRESPPDLPPMPLGRVYVEPVCAPEGPHENPRPIQAKLTSWLGDKPSVAVVQADFGHGKSLSARRLAADLAAAWLNAAAPVDAWFPVFVRCAHAYDASLATMVRRAQRGQLADADGPHLGTDDAALALPTDGQRVLIILDGLDEVHLDAQKLGDLFQHLDDHTTDRCRIVVFSRPALLQGLNGTVRRFRIQSFSNSQIDQWIEAWRTNATDRVDPERLTITRAAIEARGMAELARTPILLFMIAWTWRVEAAEGSDVVDVYGRYFEQLTRSKCVYEPDPVHDKGHKVVRRSAMELRRRLAMRGLVSEDAEPATALLWLLGRIAWESRRKAHVGKALLERHVEVVLRQELELEAGPAFELINRGVMLGLQFEPLTDDLAVETGDRTFRDYLVAWYWRARLTTEPFEEAALLGARLLEEDNESFDFLVALARRGGQAASIARVAEDCFRDERLGNQLGPTSIPREDLRLHLRRVALALRCELGETRLQLADADPVRSLVALHIARGTPAELRMVRIDGCGLDLSNLPLSRSNLENADLHEARLSRADLSGANLCGADLSGQLLGGVKLSDARFRGANLEGANLRSAMLVGADFGDANLQGAGLAGANLAGADLSRAKLDGADLRGASMASATVTEAQLNMANVDDANLVRANLRHATLNGTSLRQAVIEGADLEAANLEDAKLEGANLEGANLRGANLKKANLEGANLRGANLEGAKLEGANLNNANLDGAVLDRSNAEGARFEGADLESASLVGARLVDARLGDANLMRAMLMEATLVNATLAGTVLLSANLTGTDLRQADLRKADLEGVLGIRRALNLNKAVMPEGFSLADWPEDELPDPPEADDNPEGD